MRVWSNAFHLTDREALAKYDIIMVGDLSFYRRGAGYYNDDIKCVADIKRINPNAQVYLYQQLSAISPYQAGVPMTGYPWMTDNVLRYEDIVANDWFLWSQTKELVREGAGMLMLDVGAAGFAEYFVERVVGELQSQPYDGVIFDMWFPVIEGIGSLAVGELPLGYDSAEAWGKAWHGFVEHVCGRLRTTVRLGGVPTSGYLTVMGNQAGDLHRLDPDSEERYFHAERYEAQRRLVDGVIYERTVLGWKGEFMSVDETRRRIKSINEDPLEAWFGEKLNPLAADYQQKRKYSLAAKLVAAHGEQAYNHDFGDTNLHWDAYWDADLGDPLVGEAEPLEVKPGFWTREYMGGLVALNASDETHRLYLARYRTMEGKRISRFKRVPPRTGVILRG